MTLKLPPILMNLDNSPPLVHFIRPPSPPSTIRHKKVVGKKLLTTSFINFLYLVTTFQEPTNYTFFYNKNFIRK